jgi:hypothetical protein
MSSMLAWSGLARRLVPEITDAAAHTRGLARIPRNLGREHEALVSTYLAQHVNDA